MAEVPREKQTFQTEKPVDTLIFQYDIEKLRSDQNLGAGILAGGITGLLGASLWAGITVVSNYQIGWMAVGVGFLVGVAVRTFGNGIDKTFGIVGAFWSLIGCALGNLLAVCGALSIQENIPFFVILSNLNYELIGELITATFNPLDLLFYGIALYEGYRFSFRQF